MFEGHTLEKALALSIFHRTDSQENCSHCCEMYRPNCSFIAFMTLIYASLQSYSLAGPPNEVSMEACWPQVLAIAQSQNVQIALFTFGKL